MVSVALEGKHQWCAATFPVVLQQLLDLLSAFGIKSVL